MFSSFQALRILISTLSLSLFSAASLILSTVGFASDISVDLLEIGKTVELEIGRVIPSEMKTLKVHIHNKTRDHLTINKMIVSCRCLTPIVDGTILKPRESVAVSVSYKVTSTRALNDKQSIVFIDPSGRVILKLIVTARVRADLSSTMEKIVWTNEDVVTKRNFRCLVFSFSEKPPSSLMVSSNDSWLSLEIRSDDKPTERDATASWAIDVALKSDKLPCGIHKSNFSIADSNDHKIFIPVEVTIASPFTILPDRVLFDLHENGRSSDIVELKMRSRADIPSLEVSQIKINSHRPAEIFTKLIREDPTNWTLRVWKSETSNSAFRSELSIVLPEHISKRPVVIPVISFGNR